MRTWIRKKNFTFSKRKSMASKTMLDINILLDFLLKRKQYDKARQIMALAVTGRTQAYITPSMVHISGYGLTKAYGDCFISRDKNLKKQQYRNYPFIALMSF